MTNASVDEIVVEEGAAVGVRLEDGRELRAPVVVSNAGVINTYEQLLPEGLAADIGHARKAREVGNSIAHLSLYVGLKGTTEELGLEKTNLWVYRDHQHEKNFDAFRKDIYAPLPVVYLSFPSAKDPDFERRFPGRSTIEAITLGPYEPFARWADTKWKKRGSDYEDLKASLSERLLDVLYEHAPATRGKVDIAELSTPLTTQNFAAHPEGAIYGLAHSPARYQARWLKPRTPIKGLYLTGADVVGAGLMGALMGGMSCSSAVLRGNVLGQVLKHQAQTLRDEVRGAPSNARP